MLRFKGKKIDVLPDVLTHLSRSWLEVPAASVEKSTGSGSAGLAASLAVLLTCPAALERAFNLLVSRSAFVQEGQQSNFPIQLPRRAGVMDKPDNRCENALKIVKNPFYFHLAIDRNNNFHLFTSHGCCDFLAFIEQQSSLPDLQTIR